MTLKSYTGVTGKYTAPRKADSGLPKDAYAGVDGQFRLALSAGRSGDGAVRAQRSFPSGTNAVLDTT